MKRRLSDFEGCWQLSRQIEHTGGGLARFTGEAHFAPHPAGLHYEETGEIRLVFDGQAGPAFSAKQSYVWDPALNVFFEDGRFFHQIPSAGGDVTHDCPPDFYKGHYDFTPWPNFTISWTVTGPRKSYRSETRFSRSGV